MRHVDDDDEEAFPRVLEIYRDRDNDRRFDVDLTAGMSLRDYFAGQAIGAVYENFRLVDYSATRAYEIADAMLKARKA